MSVLSVANNSFSGPILINSYCTTLSLASFDGNQISGPLPDFSQCASLRSINAQQNPHMFTSCSPQEAFANTSACLPPFLTVDYSNTEMFDETNTQCASFAGIGGLSGLQVSMDLQTYLYGAQCNCQQLFFWPPQPDNVTGLNCIACPVSAYSPVSWCQCDRGTLDSCYAVQNTLSGAWTALECPYIASPYVTACSFRIETARCSNALHCQCAPGYMNRRCAQCAEGYFTSGRACSLCNPVLKWLLPTLYVIVIVVFLLYLLRVQGSRTGTLKIASFYGQSLLLVVSNASVPWPQAINSILQASSHTGSLSLTALECVVEGITLSQLYAVYMVTPAVLVLVCLVIFLFRRKSSDAQVAARAGSVFVSMTLSVLLTTYFDVSVKVLSAFSCTLTDAADSQHMYLNAFPWIACDASSGSVYQGLLAAGVLGCLIYMAGVPAMALVLLARARRGDLQSDDNMRRLGFIYGCYRPTVFYWEAVLLLRRMVLALTLTVMPFTAPEISVVFIMFVLLFSIAAQHSLQPFASALENRLEQLVLYVLTVTFLGVYVSQTSADTPSPLTWLPVVLVVLNVFAALFLGFCVVLVWLANVVNRPAIVRLLTRMGLPAAKLNSSLEHVQKSLGKPLLDDVKL
eukprot:TRINITY_DN8082_c0_g4_i1.p1 TRINITY_DN8082_c0_g4~~TRINITY_DN8082_c0_g4_i1.p1  ORF type:complete len:630 (-),score=118.58 TRINITY_DN8082_c0_g4_i1:8-1897(-)